MLRWKAMFLGSALFVATLTGCTQQCFLSQDTLKEFTDRAGLPPNTVSDPSLGTIPKTSDVQAPPDVNHPEREPWYITLNECIARALENGTVGTTSVRQLGLDNIDLLQDAQGSFSPRT